MNKDNENLTEVGRLILNIADAKGLNEGQLATRVGYKAQSNLHDRLKNDLRLSILCKICDSLGVELCIIDGWEKHRLNDFKSNKDLELFLKSMKEQQPNESSRDKWLEKNAEDEAKAERLRISHNNAEMKYRSKEGREAYNARMKEYQKVRRHKKQLEMFGDKCATCRYTEARLEKDGYRHYCSFYEDYKAEIECKNYEPKPLDL